MQYIDHHVHTIFSGDCHVPMNIMIESCINKGQQAVMLTDHIDYDFPDKSFNFEIDFHAYNRCLSIMRQTYPTIDIRKGVEIGYQPHLYKPLNDLIKKESFDFIILSFHTCDHLDYMNGDFFKGKNKKESYHRYFENIYTCIQTFDTYDVIGHLDFIIRYAPYQEKSIPYKEYKSLIDDILKLLIRKNKGIELNTSGQRYGLNMFHPQTEILSRYYELGGRIITIGSDAHMDKDVQADFQKAFMTIKKIGYKEVTEYKARNATMVNIDEILKKT